MTGVSWEGGCTQLRGASWEGGCTQLRCILGSCAYSGNRYTLEGGTFSCHVSWEDGHIQPRVKETESLGRNTRTPGCPPSRVPSFLETPQDLKKRKWGSMRDHWLSQGRSTSGQGLWLSRSRSSLGGQVRPGWTECLGADEL